MAPETFAGKFGGFLQVDEDDDFTGVNVGISTADEQFGETFKLKNYIKYQVNLGKFRLGQVFLSQVK